MHKYQFFALSALMTAGLVAACDGDLTTAKVVSGATTLVTSIDAPTSACATGGKVVSIGVDDNKDGTLQDTEVDSSFPVCSGAVGATGATGSTGATGTQGQQGETGLQGPRGEMGPMGPWGEIGAQGQQGETGLKGDKGHQGDMGMQGPQGVKGKDGVGPAFRVEVEYPGSNCALGGKSLQYGTDDNANGLLDGDESDGTLYVCSSTCGEYTCGGSCGTCATGLTCGAGVCNDIDECATPVSPCDVNATCRNTTGAYECVCNTGYTGSGTICTEIPPFNGSFEQAFDGWEVMIASDSTSNQTTMATVLPNNQTYRNGESITGLTKFGPGQQLLEFGDAVTVPDLDGALTAAVYVPSRFTDTSVSFLARNVTVPTGATRITLETGIAGDGYPDVILQVNGLRSRVGVSPNTRSSLALNLNGVSGTVDVKITMDVLDTFTSCLLYLDNIRFE